ncbi:MAG: hypothetical protein ACWA44_02530 [Thiotrichales bacterium]
MKQEKNLKLKALELPLSEKFDFALGNEYWFVEDLSDGEALDYPLPVRIESISWENETLVYSNTDDNEMFFCSFDYFAEVTVFKSIDDREVIEVEVIKEVKVPVETEVIKEVEKPVPVLVDHFDETFWDMLYRWYCKKKKRRVESEFL